MEASGIKEEEAIGKKEVEKMMRGKRARKRSRRVKEVSEKGGGEEEFSGKSGRKSLDLSQ